MIVGRDMAGTKSSMTSEDFYGPYDAQAFVKRYANELGMEVVTYENMVYTDDGYMAESEAKQAGKQPYKLSGTEFRKLLRSGADIPDWFAFKSVVNVLREESVAQQ